ncbi:MAG: hypothetical protein ACRYFX_28680 [Janthinobacterium lividum]
MRFRVTLCRWHALVIPAVGLLGGCSVYTPMQGAAPEIRHKGELEATGSWSLTNRVEAAITYSPLNHLLVRAATGSKGGGHPLQDSASFSQLNQYELAVGTYWPLGPHWLVGGLAGFGQAHAEAHYAFDGDTFIYFGSPAYHRFNAIYGKYSGEAYATWQPSPRTSMGLSYRVVQLRLTDVTDNGVPVAAAPILRYEPMLYLRWWPGSVEQGLVQVQLAIGVSSTFGYDERSTTARLDPARQFKLSRGYTSLGLAFYPHLLWQHKR